jgi:hypothetical protein
LWLRKSNLDRKPLVSRLLFFAGLINQQYKMIKETQNAVIAQWTKMARGIKIY